MQQYLVTTPNPKYGGKVFGIKFNNGKAIVDAHTLDPQVGLTIDQIAARMGDEFGYTVEPLSGGKTDGKK